MKEALIPLDRNYWES